MQFLIMKLNKVSYKSHLFSILSLFFISSLKSVSLRSSLLTVTLFLAN